MVFFCWKNTLSAAKHPVHPTRTRRGASTLWLPGYKMFFMLNSAEHEICPANKSQITNHCKFFLAKCSWEWNFLCKQIWKCQLAQLSWAWKKFYNLGPWSACLLGTHWISKGPWFIQVLFVCVEVLQASQHIWVILSVVSLPNYTISWAGLVLWADKQQLCTFFCQKLTTALLQSVEGREWL